MSTSKRHGSNRPRNSQAWPRLSEALPHLHPLKCAGCGLDHYEELLTLWQECDQQDQPEIRYVLLCESCGDRMIEPHVRLYARIDRNSPAPGAMEICADCRYREGLWCAKVKAHGGPGITIQAPKPMTGFWDGTDSRGRRTGGRFSSFAYPPHSCSAKEPSPDKIAP